MSRTRGFVVASVVALLPGLLLSGSLMPAVGAEPARPTGMDPTAEVAAALSEGSDSLGRWRVRPGSSGGFTLTWRAPGRIPVTDARPEFLLSGRSLGAPGLAADGRTLTLTVDLTAAPDVDDLAVVLSGRELDSGAPAVPPDLAGEPDFSETPFAPTGPAVTLPVDPGRAGPFRVVTSDYRLPGRRIAGMPARIEMMGHVVRPADAPGTRPLVLFLHGRHEPCFGGRGGRPWPCPRGSRPVPSHLGYEYVQRLLAGQGYVTVSISANGINAQDFLLRDGGAAARAVLTRQHLLQWARWADAGRFDVDMSRVVLVGHSRGGEGVNELTLKTPLTAPFQVAGQVLLAPTNFGRKVAAYVPTVTVLPYCDGDVVDLQGQSYTDLGRDLVADDTALRSSVMMLGTNHNFFNTEWTPGASVAPSVDDGQFLPGRLCKRGAPTRLRPRGQRAVGQTYIAGAVHLMADGDEQVLPMFDGSRVSVPSAGRADVRVHAVGGGRAVRRPGSQATVDPTSTAATRLCSGRAGSQRRRTCGSRIAEFRTPHWVPDFPLFRGLPATRVLQMAWSRPRRTGGLLMRRPMNLTRWTHLDLRTAVDPRRGPVRVAVRLHDGSGGTATLTGARGRRLAPMPGADPFVFGKIWAQNLRVPLARAVGVDLTDVRRVELVGLSRQGRVWLLDVAAVDPTAALAPVPRLRVPRVRLTDVRVREGDGARRRVARVPFTVRGTVRSPASFVVVGLQFDDGSLIEPRRVTLRPGQTRGVVRVPYRSDNLDDRPVQRVGLIAVPVRGVAFSNALAVLALVDDDPTPRLSIRRVRATVAEGGDARWRVRLSRKVGYHVAIPATVVPGPGRLPRLSVDDVPTGWLRERYFPLPPAGEPLHKQRPFVFEFIEPGRRTAVLRVPLLRDGVTEGRETVTLHIRVAPRRLHAPVRSTVTVVD